MNQISKHTRLWAIAFTGALFASAMFVLPATAADDTRKHAVTADDLLALKHVASPQISPDGEWIAYTVRQNNLEKDDRTTQIFMVSRDGKTILQMTSGMVSASNPRWGPDGRYLAFLAARPDSDDDAKSQVWTLDLRGGEAQPYTDIAQGVDGFEWSPDGARMALLITDQSDADIADAAARENGEEPDARPWVINRLQFKQDGAGYLDRSRTHIYVSSGRLSPPLQLTFGDFDDDDPVWSPSGEKIAFVSNRTAEPDSNENSDIWVVPAQGGAKTRRPHQVTDNPGADYAPAWSPDGARLAHITVTEPKLLWYATNHLAVIPAAGGAATVLTETLDRNVADPVFSANGGEIMFALEDSGEVQLAVLDLATGTIMRRIEGGLEMTAFDLHASGAVAATISRPEHPAEVFLFDGGALMQLTETNKAVLDRLNLATMTNATFESTGGANVEGFFYAPKSKKRRPAIVRIHGGPVSQYDFGFNDYAQLFAGAGYSVILVNPRGSSGYGQDYSAALFAEWGVKDFDDIMAGVDYAVKHGWAHPDRLGVGGWSYGGILTNHVITKTNRFKAAVTGASEVIYIANYGHDIYQREWEMELGLPWENREAWERITPFNDVAKVETPTLIMGGKEDWNVPINNSEQLYQALKRLGVPTELVVYPGETHGFRRPSFIKDRYERHLEWYARYLK